LKDERYERIAARLDGISWGGPTGNLAPIVDVLKRYPSLSWAECLQVCDELSQVTGAPPSHLYDVLRLALEQDRTA